MPQLGLSLSSSATSFIQYVLGFPTRIKITSANLSFTDNLLKSSDDSDSVFYLGSHSTLLFGKTDAYPFGTIEFTSGASRVFENWTAGATSLPRTGWQQGYVISEANPLSVTITASTPQTFTYNASNPTIVFSNDLGLASNFFSFSPAVTASFGTRSTTISLVANADYVASNSPSVSYTINKKNVTIALASQSSTYAPNQSYDPASLITITSLSGADTISGGSFINLVTGTPEYGSNAGSYTISFNPNYTSTNYNITNSPASVTWTISKANQTITFNPFLTGINGQTQSLSASSTSGLSVALSVVSGPATLAGSTLTYTGTGNVVVRASQAGNTNYNVATNVDKTIVVSAPPSSNIPVASTSSVTISNYTLHPNISAGYTTGTINRSGYTKRANLTTFYGYNNVEITTNGGISYVNESTYDTTLILAPNVSLETPNSGTFYSGVNKWRIAGHINDDGDYIGLGFYVAGSAYPTEQYILQNDSTDITQIPTSGWYVFDRSTNTNLGASSITITAS